MSLINEALRKARKEAGAKEDGRLRINTSAHGSARSGVGTALVLGAFIAAIAAVGGAGAVWWLLADQQPQKDLIANTINGDETGLAEASGKTPLPGDKGETDNAGTSDSVKQPPGIANESPTASPQLAITGPVDPPPNPTPPATDKRDFLAEADLGTAQLSLDYIVYRTNDPYAEINGIEVHVGHHIEGFVVEEITSDLVRLSDENGPLILRAQ